VRSVRVVVAVCDAKFGANWLSVNIRNFVDGGRRAAEGSERRGWRRVQGSNLRDLSVSSR
jgi:hypothetical protein